MRAPCGIQKAEPGDEEQLLLAAHESVVALPRRLLQLLPLRQLLLVCVTRTHKHTPDIHQQSTAVDTQRLVGGLPGKEMP
jgi:hypothetical protein